MAAPTQCVRREMRPKTCWPTIRGGQVWPARVSKFRTRPSWSSTVTLKGVPTNRSGGERMRPLLSIASMGEMLSFIKVVTVTRDVVPAFLVAVGATSSDQKSATATAGQTVVACNVQPMMLCNPFTSGSSNFADHVSAGDLFGFTAVGNNSTFAAGVFNLLDPVGQTHSGAQDISRLLSQTTPRFCFADDVSPRTGGASGPVANGINVRFDMPVPGGNPQGLDTTPAPNVIKGRTSNCNSSNFTNANALPLATGLTQLASTLMCQSGTCTFDTTKAPFDTANANAYWLYHHGSPTWPAGKTRYQVYQMELDGSAPFVNVPPNENPAPTCTSPAGNASRRLIDVAIVDCDPPIPGNSVKSVRSNSYAEFFLVRPVDQGRATNPSYPAGIIWAEFVQMVTLQNSGGKLHTVIQLYR